MAIQAAIIKEYEDNFLLDEAKFRKVASILIDYAAKLKTKSYVEFYVEREDQTSYTTKNIEEVLADENAIDKRIVTVSISIEPSDEAGEQAIEGKPKPDKTKAFIGFTKNKSPRVRIGLVNENRDWCFLLSDELDNQIKRLLRNRPLRFISLKILDGVVFFVGLGALFTWIVLWLHSRPPAFTPDQISQMTQDQKLTELLKRSVRGESYYDWVYPIVMVFTIIMMFVFLYRPLARLVEYLTESTFHWGDAVSHFNRREKLANNIKWGVIIAFVISVVSGLATTGLLNFWTKH